MCILINPSKITCGYSSKNKQVLVAKWVAEEWEIKTKKEMAIHAFRKWDTTTEGGSGNHLVHFEQINFVMLQPKEEFHFETSNDENTYSSYSAHDAMSSSNSDEDNELTTESYYFVAHNLCITKKNVFNPLFHNVEKWPNIL